MIPTLQFHRLQCYQLHQPLTSAGPCLTSFPHLYRATDCAFQLLRLALARGNDPHFAAPRAAVLPLNETSPLALGHRLELRLGAPEAPVLPLNEPSVVGAAGFEPACTCSQSKWTTSIPHTVWHAQLETIQSSRFWRP